jgi:hypothetical protein
MTQPNHEYPRQDKPMVVMVAHTVTAEQYKAQTTI